MEDVKTNMELGFGEPRVGFEWDAGVTTLRNKHPGRWTVRRDENSGVVPFHFLNAAEYIIHTFPPTEDGEKAAKTMVLKLVDIAWGRDGDKDHRANRYQRARPCFIGK